MQVWATLLALEDDGEMVVGVVSAPAMGRRWWAARGAGAFTTDVAGGEPRRLRVSGIRELGDAQMCFGGFEEWRQTGRLDVLLALSEACWRTRGYGDFWQYMLVAEGAAEIALDPAVALWDVAAPMVVVEEAGGRFTDFDGRRHARPAATGSAQTASCTRRRGRSWRALAPASSGGRAGSRSYSGHGTTVRRGRRAERGARHGIRCVQRSRATGRRDGADVPLATRMRPTTLDELVGQERLLAAGSALRRAIEEGHPHSMILHGPPGSGKTTLARLVAHASDAALEEESAVAAGRAEVRAVIERARERLRSGRRTVFFLDEIHRFNKAQQDALLPAVEDGVITLIGATTENPYFEVNSALISRTHLYQLEALGPAQIRTVLERAVAAGHCGPPENVDEAALDFLAERSGGDARTALNALELACEAGG